MKNETRNIIIVVFVMLLGVALVLLQLLRSPQCNIEDSAATAQESLSVDVLHTDEPIDLKTKRLAYKYSHNNIEVEIEVDYPIEGSDLTLAYLRNWINRKLGGSYPNSLSNGQSLVDFYGEKEKKDLEEMASDDELGEGDGMNFSYSNSVSLLMKYHSEKYVNFEVISSYYCSGGAHGMYSFTCSTIRLDNGDEIDSLIFSDRLALQPMLKEGLKEALGCDTDEGLQETIFADISKLPLPSSIWLIPKGVVFHYNIYEIAAYCYGEQEFTVPYSKIKSYIKPQYQELCE